MDTTIIAAKPVMTQAMLNQRPQKTIKAEVILGSPGSGCQGVGICRIMAFKELKNCHCKIVTAWITANENGNLSIRFWKSGMDTRYIKRHFGWMLFQVFEAYELPPEFAYALGLEQAIVQPGIYPVWESTGFMTVDF